MGTTVVLYAAPGLFGADRQTTTSTSCRSYEPWEALTEVKVAWCLCGISPVLWVMSPQHLCYLVSGIVPATWLVISVGSLGGVILLQRLVGSARPRPQGVLSSRTSHAAWQRLRVSLLCSATMPTNEWNRIRPCTRGAILKKRRTRHTLK